MTIPENPASITRITLRVPTTLHQQIYDAAQANGGTVTSEILARLEASTVRDELKAQAREIADLKRMLVELLAK